MKDETRPVQVKHKLSGQADLRQLADNLLKSIETSPSGGKITETPRIGHKLHRLTTMTSCTPQFHLLAHGNPKPENLLLSPLEQFGPDGLEKEKGLAQAVGVDDRELVGQSGRR